ncbi:MAG: RagB/SusD family nutrient uptake outer membrane protein [Bacteroidaceae bacterium]|nr:RagB/SusD family nutrient uptake outer membrane protein [Bacteroidaceae bacterium]
MKKMKYMILLLCAMMVATTSCDDFLDITPDGQVKRDPLLSTAEGIEDAMYGVYAQMRQQTLYGQELHFSTLEILSQTLWCYGSTGVTAMSGYKWEHSSVKSVFEGVWTAMYKNISNVNSILDAPLVVNATEFPYTLYRGEALGMRAFMHFDLVRLFAAQYTVNPAAGGIPYATEFSLKTPEFESLAKNYEHIVADLLEAEALLADEEDYAGSGNFMLDRQIHFNLHAVRATLARVYLTMGNNEMAALYAQKVISGGKFSLKEKTEVVNDLAGVLSRKETIFGIYFPGFYTNVSGKLHQVTSYYSLDLRDDFMELYERDASGLDFRTMAYFSESGVGDDVKYRLCKFTDIYELNNMSSDRPAELILGVNLIRLPEMYYIAAEALLDSDYDTALTLYNDVRMHRGLDPLEADKTLTVELINDERYKEMIGEGQTYFNMKRQNLPILSHDGKSTYNPADGIYSIPVPDVEIENRK